MKKALFTIAATLTTFGLMGSEASDNETQIIEPAQLQEKSSNTVTNPLVYDRYFSPHASSADLLTLHRALQKGEDALFDGEPSDTFLGGVGRLAELAFIWEPLNAITAATQYSLGYRAKQLELGNSEKEIWKNVSKFVRDDDTYADAHYTMSAEDRVQTTSAVSAAGQIMQNRMAMDWVEKKSIDGREASLYMVPAIANTTHRVIHFSNGSKFHEKNLLEMYAHDIYAQYGVELEADKMKQMSALNFVDPMIWMGVYSEIYYVVTGKAAELPMIPVGGGVKWLPAMGLELTPSGPEWVSKHYFRTPSGNPIMVYGKYGRLSDNKHWGTGVEMPKLFTWGNNSAGLKLDFFEQISANEDDSIESKYGGAASVINSTEIADSGVCVYTQLGYKTAGYLAGEPMKKGVIARGGLALNF